LKRWDAGGKPLTSDDDFVRITQAAIEEVGFSSELGYWNDYNPKRSRPHSFIGVLEVYPAGLKKTVTNKIARLEMRPEAPHWTALAIIHDDGGESYRKHDEIDVHDPDSLQQLKVALVARARTKLGMDWTV
jgi:hypothetical protein